MDSPSGLGQCAYDFHGQAIALDPRDAHALTDSGWSAAGAPIAIADAYAAVMLVDCDDYRHDLSDQASRPVVQKRIAAVGVAVCVKAAPDQHREQSVEREE